MKTLNVQFIIDTGNDDSDKQAVDLIRNQMKANHKLLPKSIKVLFGEK